MTAFPYPICQAFASHRSLRILINECAEGNDVSRGSCKQTLFCAVTVPKFSLETMRRHSAGGKVARLPSVSEAKYKSDARGEGGSYEGGYAICQPKTS